MVGEYAVTTSYHFLLLPITPSVSCSCLGAQNTPSSKLPLSPTVSLRLPLSATSLSLLPNPHPKADHETIREMLVTDKMDLEDEDWDSKIESSRVACLDAFIQNVSIMAGKAHPTADPVVKEAREQFIEKMKLGLRVAISKYQSVQVNCHFIYLWNLNLRTRLPYTPPVHASRTRLLASALNK